MAACDAELYVEANGDIKKVVKFLLKREDLDVNLTNANGETALNIAFKNESNDEIKSLLVKNKSTNLRLDGMGGGKSLFFVCGINYCDGVDAVINYYNDNDDQITLLNICNKKYDYVSSGLSTDIKLTPLQLACINHHLDIVLTLLGIPDIDVNGIGLDSNTTLHFACISPVFIENNTGQKDIEQLQDALFIIEVLLRHPDIEKQQANFAGLLPFDVLINTYTVQEILWQICELGYTYALTWVIACVPEPELLEACHHRQIPEGLNNLALTSLQLACIKGNVSIVSRLLTIPNIDVDAPLPRTGLTTLSLMFSRLLRQVDPNKVVDIVNLLLSVSQTDVNRIDASQYTVLMRAISSNIVPPDVRSLTVIEQLAFRSLPTINHSSPLIGGDQQELHTALDICISRAIHYKNDGDELRYNYYLQIMNTLFTLNAKRRQTQPEVPADLIKAQIRIGSSSLSRFDQLSAPLGSSSSKISHLVFCQSATSLPPQEEYQALTSSSQEKNGASSSSSSSASGLSENNELNKSKSCPSVFSGPAMYPAAQDEKNKQDSQKQNSKGSGLKHARHS